MSEAKKAEIVLTQDKEEVPCQKEREVKEVKEIETKKGRR